MAERNLVVEKLAAALDGDDFAAVERLLAPNCAYRTGPATYTGPEAVVASYQRGSALARRLFDRVDYRHETVDRVGDREFLVDFVDELTYQGDVLVHHSRQVFEVGADGLVIRIDDVTDDGESKRVDEFLARHGLRR